MIEEQEPYTTSRLGSEARRRYRMSEAALRTRSCRSSPSSACGRIDARERTSLLGAIISTSQYRAPRGSVGAVRRGGSVTSSGAPSIL
jgi:hypothetical protein